jgi:HEAT repeat protein
MKSTLRVFPVVALAALATPLTLISQQVVRSATATSAAAITPSVVASSAVAPPAMVIPEGYVNENERQADSALKVAKRVLEDGDYREAAQLFARLAERYPRTAQASEALYFRAFSLFRAGGSTSLSSALEALTELNRLYPTSSSNRNDARSLRIRICGELARRGNAPCAEEVSAAASSSASSSSSPSGGQQSGSCPSADDDNDERIMALNALLNMNAEAAVPMLERVLARRDDCSRGLRKKAVFLMAQKRAPGVVDALLKVAREDPAPEVREDAVFWLSNVRDPRVVDVLADMATNSNDAAIQEKAIFALSNTRSERASQVLRDIAQREGASKQAREQAIFWLGNRRDTSSTAFLRGLYTRLTDRELKEKVLYSVANQRGNESGAWLVGIAMNERESMELRKQALFWAGNQRAVSLAEISAMYDRIADKELKEQIIFVLSQNRAEASVDKLMDIARRDTDRDMRSKAIFWLGQSRDPRVLKFLEELINR